MVIRYSILILTFLFGLIIFEPISYSQSTDSDNGSQNNDYTTGSTFFTDKGGDLDILIERKHPANGIGSFVIDVTGALPGKSAQLSINAFDIDEERGETVGIHFNDHFVGNLSGTNNDWNTTVFDLKNEWIKKGPNSIKFVIMDSSKSGTINWSGKIGWGQILIDGGAADKGKIINQSILHTPKNNDIYAEISTTVSTEKSGRFQLEIAFLDPSGNAVVSRKKEFNLKAKQTQLIPLVLNYDQQMPTGNYKYVTSLFYESGEMWIQQDSRSEKHFRQKEMPLEKHLISIKNPIKDRELTQDDPDTIIDLSEVFTVTLKGENVTQGLEPVVMSILLNSNPDLMSVKIKDNQLTLMPNQGRHGMAKITIRGTMGQATADNEFMVTLKKKEPKLVIMAPISNLIVKENSANRVINLEYVFKDINFPNTMLEKKVLSNDNPYLLIAGISENSLNISFEKGQTGKANITVRAFSHDQWIDNAFSIEVTPVLPAVVTDPSLKTVEAAKKEPLAAIQKPLTVELTKEQAKPTSLKTSYLYSQFISGIQTLSGYSSSPVMGFSIGKTADNILKDLSFEAEICQTVFSHVRSFSITSTHYQSELNARSVGIYAVYTVYAQVPTSDDLFSRNPFNLRVKIGVINMEYEEISLTGEVAKTTLEENEISSGTKPSFGFSVNLTFSSSMELGLYLNQIGDTTQNTGLIFLFYF